MSASVLLPAAIYLLLMLAHFSNEPARWWCLFGQRVQIPFREWFGVLGLVALVTYLVPAKIGMPARVLVLNRRYGLPLSTVSLTLTWDMLISFAVWGGFAMLAATALAQRSIVFHLPSQLPPAYWLLAVMLLLALAIWGFYKLRHLQAWQARPQVSLARLCGVTAVLVLDVLAEGVRHIALAQALSIPVDWQVAFFGGIAAAAAGLLSLMPMGLGGYDLTLIAILVAGGGDWQSAAVLCAVNRGALLLYSFFIGFWGSRIIGLTPKELIRQAKDQVSQLASLRKKKRDPI